MKIDVDDSYSQVTRTLLVEDGPVVRYNLSSTGKVFRIERIRLDYRYDKGSWALSHPEVGGTLLKKDGTDSQNTARQVYYRGEEPEWLTEVVNQYRPHGVPAMRTEGLEIDG